MLKSANSRYFHIIITFEDLRLSCPPICFSLQQHSMLLWYIDTLHTINQHINKVLENATTKVKEYVNINDAYCQKIKELIA